MCAPFGPSHTNELMEVVYYFYFATMLLLRGELGIVHKHRSSFGKGLSSIDALSAFLFFK